MPPARSRSSRRASGMRASGAAETPREAAGAPGSRALPAGSAMSVSLAPPLAATLVVLVGLVPLGVLLSERRRLHRLCGQLGLRPPPGPPAPSRAHPPARVV